MENPTIQTDLAQILNKLDSKIDKLDEKIDKLAIGQVEIKGEIKTLDQRLSGEIKTLDQRLSGEIKALDVKTEQLNTRVGNVEFAVRGVLIGIAIIVLGGFAMFFWMSTKLP
jgi:chromosome segregation ATPase